MSKLITIIHDDREKDPWDQEFLGSEFIVKRKRLKTGDYTIGGMDEILCIEKKSNWEELALNIGVKRNRDNFEAELRRMQEYKVRILIIHDYYSRLRVMSSFRHTRTPPSTVMGWLFNIQLEYGIQVMPIGPKPIAKMQVRQILKKLHEFRQTGRIFYHATDKTR